MCPFPQSVSDHLMVRRSWVMHVRGALRNKVQYANISPEGGRRDGVIKNKLKRQPIGMAFMF
jgi:hypothetical protein